MKLALKELRKLKGLTQRTIAERLDVSEARVSCWENGKDNIPGSRILDIATAYECSSAEIFGETPIPQPIAGIPTKVAASVLQWVFRRLDMTEHEAPKLPY